MLVVGGDELVDGITDLARRGEVCAPESPTGEDAELDLDLVQPDGMGRRVMEVHVLVAG